MMNKRSVLISIGSAAVFLTGGWLYAAPYLALSEMEDAAHDGRAEVLNRYVDFPALRESLKEWAMSEMKAKLESEGTAGGMALMSDQGMPFARAVVDAIVEGVVTPEGFAKLLEGGSPFDHEAEPGESGSDYQLGYEGFSRFIVRLKPNETEGIDLILVRQGLSWKLTAVRQRVSLAATRTRPSRRPVDSHAAAAPPVSSEPVPSVVESAPPPPAGEQAPDGPARVERADTAAVTP